MQEGSDALSGVVANVARDKLRKSTHLCKTTSIQQLYIIGLQSQTFRMCEAAEIQMINCTLGTIEEACSSQGICTANSISDASLLPGRLQISRNAAGTDCRHGALKAWPISYHDDTFRLQLSWSGISYLRSTPTLCFGLHLSQEPISSDN